MRIISGILKGRKIVAPKSLPVRPTTDFAKKADLFQYLKRVKKSFNIIFADPPYEMEGLEQLPELILSRKLLEKNGLLIVEHSKKIKFEEQAGFLFSRKYGNVNFTFFEEIEA